MKFWHNDAYYQENPHEYFKVKRVRDILIALLFIVIFYLANLFIEFDMIGVVVNAPKALTRFFELYIPVSFKESAKLIEAIFVTILLSISAGVIGSFLAYIAALTMSKRTGKNVVLKYIVRGFATFMRNVPATIWAIILLMAFWFGEFLALLVMTIGTFGFNARLFSDMIDETNPNSIEALEATGASYWQIITQAVIPETLPTFISWALYSIELNIRSATIIGMLAGGGIGHLIGIFKHYRRFDQLSGAVIVVVVVIISFDQFSMYIRKRIL